MSSERPIATSGASLTRRARVADFLGLERNIVIVSTIVFLLGAGEELWKKFLPKYLEALGAGAVAIGLFGTTKDFFDAIYQYPGGWLADHLGRRRALLVGGAIIASLGVVTGVRAGLVIMLILAGITLLITLAIKL